MFAVATFLSAFLLFQVQPMVSKALLPAFGGSYLVWGACMVFFQAVLALGYIYAHFVQRFVGVARYSRVHILLVLTAILQAPFDMAVLGSADPGSLPAASVFRVLLGVVGLPAFVLATTSLVLQRWLAESDLPGRSNPYVLYASSNLGSMLGLVTYPLLVEPSMDLHVQGWLWWGGYALLAVVHVLCRPRKWSAPESACEETGGSITRRRRLSWFLLGLAGCAVLLAVTNVLTLDVASAPFLWVLPLAVYLLAFVLVFKRKPWFPPVMQALLGWAILLGILLHLMTQLRLAVPVPLAVLLHMMILFVACVNAAGELAALRPDNVAQLTSYYVIMSLGGLAGSAVVSWMLPVSSDWLIEYPLALTAVSWAVGLAKSLRGEVGSSPSAARTGTHLRAMICMLGPMILLLVAPWAVARVGGGTAQPGVLLVVCGLPLALLIRMNIGRPMLLTLLLFSVTVCMTWTEQLAVGARGVLRLRNFYGIYKVYDLNGERILQHGTTQHGRQYLDPQWAGIPLAYFHPTTPAARVLTSPLFHFTRIGMVGLGTGALVTYGRPGSEFDIYELDPDNVPIAHRQFSYLHMARTNGVTVNSITGDARLSVHGEEDGIYDVFIVDAFSSGSIPVHLITVEAFVEYMRVLGPSGILLLHISNRVLDLHPVIYSAAEVLKLHACEQTNAGTVVPGANDTFWMAVTADSAVASNLTASLKWSVRARPSGGWPRPWTDRYANIIGAVGWK